MSEELATTIPPRSCRRSCCLGCLMVVILAVIPVALLLTPPSPPPPPPPEKRAEIKAHLEAVKKEAQEVVRDASTGKPHAFTFRLTEQEMNSFLTTDNQVKGILKRHKIEQAFIRIEDDTLKITVKRQTKDVPLIVTGTLIPEISRDKTPSVRVKNIALGRMPVPNGAASRLTDTLTRIIRANQFAPNIKFHAIRIENNALVLTGDTK